MSAIVLAEFRTGGAFLETDPIGTQDDTNLYAYTGNDPINLTDPSGLDPFGAPIPPTFLGFVAAPCSLCNATLTALLNGDILVTALQQPSSWFNLNTIHYALDVASFAPSFVGSGASALDAGVYALQGDRTGAGFSLAAAGIGLVADAGAAKLTLRGVRTLASGTNLVLRNPITDHAALRFAQRGISERMVQTAIAKGEKFYDIKNGLTPTFFGVGLRLEKPFR